MSEAEKFALLFPMVSGKAGQTSYRPLETVAGETIVHRALRGFEALYDRIDTVYFIFTEAEEAAHEVTRHLEAIVTDLPYVAVLLPAATAGPAETVAEGVRRANIAGRAIVCDIDHRVDPMPLIAAADAGPVDVAIATWPLNGESLKRWSVACIDSKDAVREVAERQLPHGSGRFAGIIGCYHFRDIADVADRCLSGGHARFASYFNLLAEAGHPAQAVALTEAEFFGDAERIREIEQSETRFRGTIFCDIDGTLLVHEDVPNYSNLPVLLDGSREKLQRWMDDGYMVVLCTARSGHEEAALTAALDKLGVRYHHLLCGLPSGPRILINDRKPSAIFTQQAHSFEIARNQGITGLELPSTDHPTVLRRFEGGSFAETLLLEQDGRVFVRKRATKHENLAAGYARLRAQYRTVERFGDMCDGLVPKLLGERDDSHEYYYDMEYLDGYRQLNLLEPAPMSAALATLLDRFDERIYSHKSRAPGVGDSWFDNHIETKIYAKMDDLGKVPTLAPLIVGDGVTIDGERFASLETLMFDATGSSLRSVLTPQFLSVVHGDFTFQNILVGPGDGDVRVIDMESSIALDAIELDLGKMQQSILSQYDDWHMCGQQLTTIERDGGITLNYQPSAPDVALIRQMGASWGRMLMCSPEQVDIKGSFYLGLHLIRMVPFRLRESEDQALYALATGLQWITRALSMAREV